jgi:hypothetical protein
MSDDAAANVETSPITYVCEDAAESIWYFF